MPRHTLLSPVCLGLLAVASDAFSGEHGSGEAAERYVAWLDAANREKGLLPGAIAASRSPSGGTELAAARPFREGEWVFAASPRFSLSEQSGGHRWRRWLQEAAPLRVTASDSGEGPPSFLPLALALAMQFASAAPSWRALLGVLPRPGDLPHLAELPRQLLGDFPQLQAWVVNIEEDAVRIAAALAVDLGLARHALLLVRSRAVHCWGRPVLHPAVSLMNHGGEDANVIVEGPDCLLLAARPIAKGETLRIHYGGRPCMAWLLVYGFLPANLAHDSERVTVALPPLEFEEADPDEQALPEDLVILARSVNAQLRCDDEFFLPPPLRLSREYASASARLRNAAPSDDTPGRFLHCLWVRAVGFGWPHLLAIPGVPGIDELVRKPVFGIAEHVLPGTVLALAAKFRANAAAEAPWQDATASQLAWWQGMQRCISRQADILDEWVEVVGAPAAWA